MASTEKNSSSNSNSEAADCTTTTTTNTTATATEVDEEEFMHVHEQQPASHSTSEGEPPSGSAAYPSSSPVSKGGPSKSHKLPVIIHNGGGPLNDPNTSTSAPSAGYYN
ncbi:uncharacterized protein EI97DRAFT_454036 [Westerdykella ornata]|uniref:Uncharacterized protein n=1 Tax=Westerdykella ornata TaxID=318751 RepID=A0A6A6JW03_WESOR|nr:uncharacterized protein EI97DRAFT_454036 [Westerdykella ornata]KAF2280791.1 hypothetical protein EI97DRAFT_454036 [Westerdykella ornata]